MATILDHLVVLAAAMVTTLVATPLVRAAAGRLGAVDRPDPRRVHKRPTPTMGGLALFAGFLAALGVALALPGFEEVFRTTSEPQAILLAAAVIVALGVYDDLRGLRAPAKLAGQILAAGILVLFGVRLAYVYIPGNPGSIVSLGAELGALVTIVVVVAMINAVNLVDGLDGLAAGVVAIAAAALFVYFQFADATTVGLASSAGLVLAAVAGACLAFLVYNFNPASIFMGDTGAMLLGLLLAAGGVATVGGMLQPSRGAFAALSVPVLVPVLVLAVPLLDTVWAIFRRLRAGRPVFSPDKKHLHHRLLAIGHSQRRAVLIIYYWSALVAFAAVGVSLVPRVVLGSVVVGGVIGAVAVAIAPRFARRGGAGEPVEEEREARHFVPSFTSAERSSQKTASDQRKRSEWQL